MTNEPQQTLSASERLLAAQLKAEKQEPKVPLRTQIRQLKDPGNPMDPWVKKFELARLTGKPMLKGRGRPTDMAVEDYACENLDLDNELDHLPQIDAANVGDIDFGAMAQQLEEENTDDASPSPPKKRKRGADDSMREDTTAPPPRKKHSADRRKLTKYCGIQSPSIHDPPLPPKKGGFSAAGAVRYLCPRCDVALSRPDTIRKHFEKCIELNGNPDALKWMDYREVARTLEVNRDELKLGSKGKAAGTTLLPTPASSPEQAPASALALAASCLPVLSPSPAPFRQPQPSRQPKTHKQLTAVCGVYSPSLNDPPIQPASYRSNQSKNRYHCPRCGYALSVADSVRKHFLSCIDKNGNPESLKWNDYSLDPLNHVTEDRAHAGAAQQASGVQKITHSPSPMSLSTAAKRKHREDDDVDEAYDESQQPRADAGRTQHKRQKRTHQTRNLNKNKCKEGLDEYAGLPRSSLEAMYPTTNPHPCFERTMQPWDRPAPGWLREIDMCTWQKRPGNTIPLHVELAWNRGEIFSIGGSRWLDPYFEEKEKKKLEEQMAAKKKREENEAFLDQFEDDE